MKYKSFISDLHVNLHPDQMESLNKWYQHMRKVSDFFTIAYYPYHMVVNKNGFKSEEEIDYKLMESQWKTIENFLIDKSKTDNYINFLGFEWQGTGEDGDHNIYFKDDMGDILLKPRYEDLVEVYSGKDVIGIPHHLAYSLGNRGKNWDTHNEKFSPIAEIYSHHGSSESDETNLKMDRHQHMGPRVDGGTVVDGLNRGIHIGIIASGDNHEVPALVKHGRAGVWAETYSKDSIWDAINKRRTFGFTDSKIITWMEVADQPMGSIVSSNKSAELMKIKVKANSSIERIELYKNGKLDQIKLVKDLVKKNDSDQIRFKFKLECGWGPDTNMFPEHTSKEWHGELKTNGKILGIESVYNSFENDSEIKDVHDATFSATSHQPTRKDGWMRDYSLKNEGFIFEIESSIDDSISIIINGLEKKYSVSELLEGSHLIVFENEAKKLVQEKSGLTEFYRSDSWYHNAYKAKLYCAALSNEYEIDASFELIPTKKEENYFVKVIQEDGQTGWTSPIWLSSK